MAFLPLSLLHKHGGLCAEETAALHRHPAQAVALLSSLSAWETAAHIVADHHEHVDGSGYPSGKTGADIHTGAQLLAIVDAFEARTHDRAYSAKVTRPLVRAILEINRCSGSQFAPEWVDVFNVVLRSARR